MEKTFENQRINGKKLIPVCQLEFWDNTKWCLRMDKDYDNKLREKAIQKKSIEFNNLIKDAKLPVETIMLTERHIKMDESDYNNIPAAQELWELQDELNKELSDGKEKDS